MGNIKNNEVSNLKNYDDLSIRNNNDQNQQNIYTYNETNEKNINNSNSFNNDYFQVNASGEINNNVYTNTLNSNKSKLLNK